MEELVLDGRERSFQALVKPAGESRPQERVEFVHIAVSLDPYVLLIKIGNIQTPGSKALISTGNLTLSENVISSVGNIPKINVNKTIIKVGKNTNQEIRRFFLLLIFCSDNYKIRY